MNPEAAKIISDIEELAALAHRLAAMATDAGRADELHRLGRDASAIAAEYSRGHQSDA